MLITLRISLIALAVTLAPLAGAQEDPALGDITPASGDASSKPRDLPTPGPGGIPGVGGTPPNGEEQVEQVLDAEAVKAEEKAAAPKKVREDRPAAGVKVETLSDLASLAPFEDVAVIQRRFLPKTGRFELSAAGFSNLNNPFYNSLGASLRAAYYFREQYAAEIIAAAFGSMARQSTDDLQKNRAITTDNVVTSKNFVGLAFKWNPIYGKITWLNRSIVPFDLNFDLGGGMTQTTSGDSVPTVHLGTSQVFALSKWVAFRWDLMWNFYQATGTDELGREDKFSQSDLFLGLGISLYFPEAKYR